MAPEIVSDVPYDYTIDIWSVGVLLYEMLHGYAPFKGKEYKEIAANIKLGQIKYSSTVA
jgi:serine/threonine protein kinase